MRRSYYTLPVLMAIGAAFLLFRWVQARPVPFTVLDRPGVRWHLVDPEGLFKSMLPVPAPVRHAVRSFHAAGTFDGVMLFEAQTRLPGWLLRLVPVAGYVHRRSGWDLCLVRESRPDPPPVAVREPVRREPGSASAWLPGDPVVTVSLTGRNPFQFTSFCPGQAGEAMLDGPSAGASLFLAAGRSPHLARLLPGLTPVRVEGGPDWIDATFVDGGRSRSVRWGAPSGPPEAAKSLSLRLLYRSTSGGLPGSLLEFIPKGVGLERVVELEAQCRPVEGGEQCQGRLTLTF